MNVSKHAKERYAERIMDKTQKSDINLFIAEHEEKIKNDIEKMVQYGTLIFSGKAIHDFNKEIVDVYLKDLWVIIVDNKKQNIITLYSIDLKFGDELNKQYIETAINKLKSSKEKSCEKKFEIYNQREIYHNLMKEAEDQMIEYRRLANELEKQVSNYGDIIKSLEVDLQIAERETREIVGALIGKNVI